MSKQQRPDRAGQKRGVVSLPVLGGSGAPTARRTPSAAAPSDGPPPIVGFVSLGCAKNLVDSERMLGQIAESGAIVSADESAADTIVVNTCGFLGAARDEALRVIEELAERKRRGELRRIVVAGCLVQRDGQSLRTQIPEIDALVGVNNRDDVPRAVWGTRGPGSRRGSDLYLGAYHPSAWSDQGRLRLTPRHYAYVRISEGCDQKCTFCTIPSIRGPMHSKPPEALVAECRELLADGARELILIGQDTTSYGTDLASGVRLPSLLRTLDGACDGARWIRLMYVYPTVLDDAVLAAIADAPRIVKYIDIPLQHISSAVLRRMGRRIDRPATERLLERIRRRIPGVTIRTTFIVGFPGETDAEFAELVEFVRGFGFEAVGAFPYSFEAETPAARLPGHPDSAVKRERYEQLMLVQQDVALAAARRRVGTTFDVVVDGPDDAGAGLVARHAGQAPEVDAVCRLRAAPRAAHEPGHGLTVQCIDTDGYDLVVRPQGRRGS